MSKFKGGLEAYKQRATENTQEVQNQNITIENNPSTIDSSQISSISKTNTDITTSNTNRKQSKEHQQVNSYVPKQLYKKVKIALVEEERGISDLISELLNDWINKRNKP